MQSVFLLLVAAGFASAESPISKSYLPPSPPSGVTGFNPGAAPGFRGVQEVGGRSLEQGQHDNGLHRTGHNDHTISTSSQGHGYGDNAAARNSVDESSEPANYNFGYMVSDLEGADFGHREERIEERAQGQYHVMLPDGRKQTVNYEADGRGFKPRVSYDSSESSRTFDRESSRSNYSNGGRDGRDGY